LSTTQGTTLLTAAPVVNSTSLTVVATTDFNADGVPDLVLQNQSTGLLQVWFMARSTIGAILSSNTITTNSWRVKAAAVCGSPFFIWQGPGGQVQYWFENDL